MSRDEEVHLDLAILMVKALFDAEVQGAHYSSLWGNMTHSRPPSCRQEAFLPDLITAVFTGWCGREQTPDAQIPDEQFQAGTLLGITSITMSITIPMTWAIY